MEGREKKKRLKADIKMGSSLMEATAKLFPNSTVEDENKLLGLFPEEIWLMVLNRVKPTDDLLVASNSSPYFRNLLLPKRTSFLFPKVWEILGMKYETSKDPEYFEYNVSEMAYGYSSRRWEPEFACILKMRQVCRLWCQAVDSFYQHLDKHYELTSEETSDRDCKWNNVECDIIGCWARAYYFRDNNRGTTRMQELFDRFSITHSDGNDRSPFLSNSVFLTVNGNGEYLNSVRNLFSLYGKHIWHCDIYVENTQPALAISLLSEYLERMPNLLSLKVNWVLFEARNDCALEKVKTEMQRKPMPALKNLRFLKTINLPMPALDDLVARNLQISTLIYDGAKSHRSEQIFSPNLQSISQLSLKITLEEAFTKLQQVNWKLKKVHLDFKRCGFISWSRIFRLVENKWGSTATVVILGLPIPRTKTEINCFIEEHKSLMLNLPQVKRLQLELSNPCSLDFILPMKQNLEQIVIWEPHQDSKELPLWEETGFTNVVKEDYKIKLLGLEDKKGTNIWEFFADLQQLDFYKYTHAPDVYTRNQWMNKKPNQTAK